MGERDEIVVELKILVRYYQQASHEFFDDPTTCLSAEGGYRPFGPIDRWWDDTSNELTERIEAFYDCLEENKNSLEEYRKMIEFLTSIQNHLKQRVDDLVYLTDRMTRLLDSPK